MFLADLGDAALPHFFEKWRSVISLRGPKGAKKEKPITKRTQTYVHIRTSPYNISQNLFGYGVFTPTQICKTLS